MANGSALEDLFATGAGLIDNLDIYRSVESNNLAYTNALMKKSAELSSTEKSISNMKNEILKVKNESNSIMDALRSVQKELRS